MKQGILLANLGSPDSPSVKDVRRYLKEFLMDGNVIDVPAPIRWMIVNLFVLPFRPKSSAHAYGKIWEPEGSPLILHSRSLEKQVRESFSEVPVSLGMRYGNPSLASAADELREAGVEECILVPLYPQFAMATVTTVIEKVNENEALSDSPMKVKVVPSFFNRDAYINALYDSAAKSLNDPYDHYLFSYHGLPERHIKKSDITGSHCLQQSDCCSVASEAHQFCYRHQVMETSKRFAARAGFKDGSWSVAFQSRLGRDPWLSPSTAEYVVQLAKQGVKKLWAIAPSFVSDNLETLEELKLQIAEDFYSAGGELFYYAPAMNSDPAWIKSLTGFIKEQL